MARRRHGGGGKSCSGKTCLIVFCTIVVVALVSFLIGFFVSYFQKSHGGDGSKYGDHCDKAYKYSCSTANLTCSNTSTCTCAHGYILDDSSPVCIKSPGQIRDLTAYQDDDNALVLTFLCPDPRDVPGNVKGYRIQKVLLNSAGLPETNTSYVLSASRVSCTNTFNDGDLGGVLVERKYTFSVRAWNDDFVGNSSHEITFYVAPRVPKLYLDYGGFKLLQKEDNTELGNTEYEVRVCSHCLLNSTRGTVLDVGLVVCVEGDGNNCKATVVTQLKNFNTWDDAKNNSFALPYLTTPSDWLTSLRAEPSVLRYIIGHNTSCTSLPATSFCNGPLPTDSQITVIVVQCNVAGCGQMRYDDIFSNKESSSGINVLAIGIGMTWLVILLVVVVVVVYLKHKNSSMPINNLSNDEKRNHKVSEPTANQLPHETYVQKNYKTFSAEAPDRIITQE